MLRTTNDTAAARLLAKGYQPTRVTTRPGAGVEYEFSDAPEEGERELSSRPLPDERERLEPWFRRLRAAARAAVPIGVGDSGFTPRTAAELLGWTKAEVVALCESGAIRAEPAFNLPLEGNFAISHADLIAYLLASADAEWAERTADRRQERDVTVGHQHAVTLVLAGHIPQAVARSDRGRIEFIFGPEAWGDSLGIEIGRRNLRDRVLAREAEHPTVEAALNRLTVLAERGKDAARDWRPAEVDKAFGVPAGSLDAKIEEGRIAAKHGDGGERLVAEPELIRFLLQSWGVLAEQAAAASSG